MKSKDEMANEDIERLHKEVGIISTKAAWIAGFDYALESMFGDPQITIERESHKHNPGVLE
jgi:hypothetical protein